MGPKRGNAPALMLKNAGQAGNKRLTRALRLGSVGWRTGAPFLRNLQNPFQTWLRGWFAYLRNA
jgi:hypothetical protein